MIVGLTGGIGTGKSTVSKFLVNNGYLVIDADLVSREVSERKDVLEEIKNEFGNEIVLEGQLNRKLLRKIVFPSKEKVEKLNAIFHPKIIERIEHYIELNKERELIFLDIPLLFECSLEYLSDMVLLVSCREDIQLKRVMERDKVEEAQAREIMRRQMTMELKEEKADYIIDNNEGIMELENKVEEFIKKILKK